MHEVLHSGDYETMQKEMSNENFSRAISMEAVNRTITGQLYDRLKLIATGQPIPEEDEPAEIPGENLTKAQQVEDVESTSAEEIEDESEVSIIEDSIDAGKKELEEDPEEDIEVVEEK